MNLIFTLIFLLSLVIFSFFSPDKALSAMTDGGQKAVTLSMSLIVIYSANRGRLRDSQKNFEKAETAYQNTFFRSDRRRSGGSRREHFRKSSRNGRNRNARGHYRNDENVRKKKFRRRDYSVCSRVHKHSTAPNDGYFFKAVFFVG